MSELTSAQLSVLRICLYGPTGSGKSTIAAHLARRSDVEIIKVAEPLHRLQRTFYDVVGMEVTGQDGELLQFLAHKIESEQPGWLARTMAARVLRCTSRIVVNDDCRLNGYAALDALGFVFVRVDTNPDERARRLRPDHRPVDAGHPVEQGLDRMRVDHLIDNSGALEHTLKAVDELLDDLIAAAGPGGSR